MIAPVLLEPRLGVQDLLNVLHFSGLSGVLGTRLFSLTVVDVECGARELGGSEAASRPRILLLMMLTEGDIMLAGLFLCALDACLESQLGQIFLIQGVR